MKAIDPEAVDKRADEIGDALNRCGVPVDELSLTALASMIVSVLRDGSSTLARFTYVKSAVDDDGESYSARMVITWEPPTGEAGGTTHTMH